MLGIEDPSISQETVCVFTESHFIVRVSVLVPETVVVSVTVSPLTLVFLYETCIKGLTPSIASFILDQIHL